MDIKLSKTNIRKQVGGSLLTNILGIGRTFASTIAKTLGLSAVWLEPLQKELHNLLNNRTRTNWWIFNSTRKYSSINCFATSLNTKAEMGYGDCEAIS